jgi:CheY-specific phosphatase CheX
MKLIEDRELLNIINKSINFLTTEMNINVLQTIQIDELKEINLYPNIASIHLSGDINSNIIFCFSDNLINEIAKKFIPKGFSKDETTQMLKELPSEIVNTIIGLSIQDFTQKNIAMSIPFIYDKTQIKNILEKFNHQFVSIKTQFGNLTCIYIDQ